jgi:CubicO group peptidase (beta-lactamase class C family)
MQTRFLPTVVALALATLAAMDAAAQTGRTLAEQLDSLAGSGVLAKRAVGTVAAVVKGNDTLLMKGYVKANVEWDVPMPADAMFEIGSATKQFTAAAILQLRDARRANGYVVRSGVIRARLPTCTRGLSPRGRSARRLATS